MPGGLCLLCHFRVTFHQVCGQFRLPDDSGTHAPRENSRRNGCFSAVFFVGILAIRRQINGRLQAGRYDSRQI